MSRSTFHGNTKVYGFRNCRFRNFRPTGDDSWFISKGARNLALKRLRAEAVAAGLSASAAQAGIYAVVSRVSKLSADELTALEDRGMFAAEEYVPLHA